MKPQTKRTTNSLTFTSGFGRTNGPRLSLGFWHPICLGFAKAENLFGAFKQTLVENALSCDKLIMLGSAGPNVNKTLVSLVTDFCSECSAPGVIDIGFCTLHGVHNSFKAGLKAVENIWEIEEFLVQVFIDILHILIHVRLFRSYVRLFEPARPAF